MGGFHSARRARPRVRRGFTLIELMVVIAVIALLAIIVVPILTSALEKGRRAKCAANLRAFAQALARASDERNGLAPVLHPTGNPYPYWYAQSNLFRFADNYGLSRQHMYCPSNPKWNRDSYWRYDGGSAFTVLGYFYFGNDNEWSRIYSFPDLPGGADKDQAFVRKLGLDQPHYNLLAADLTRRYQGEWGSGVNHATFGGEPGGANLARLDGSVSGSSKEQIRRRLAGSNVELYW